MTTPNIDPAFKKAVDNKLWDLKVAHAGRERFDAETRPPVAYPPVRSLTELLAQPDSTIRYRIDEVAPADAHTMMSAQFKAGKSTLVGNLSRSLVDCDRFLGHFAVNRPASGLVIIDDEMSPDMVKAWLRAQGIANTDAVADVITLRGNVGTFNLLDDQVREVWAKRLSGVGCDYLILDCLRPVLDALGLDEKTEAGKFLVHFDAMLAQAGVADACLVQHMGHANERARGDSRLLDWPDVIWRLVRENDEPGSVRYFSAYGRDVDVPEGRLSFDPTTRHLSYAGGSRADAKTNAAYDALVALLADSARKGEEGMSGKDIEEALYPENPRVAVRAALKRTKTAVMPCFGVKVGQHNAHLHHILHPCDTCGMTVLDGSPRHQSCASAGTS